MKIKVTEEDIRNGRKSNPVFCPVALALRRVTGRTAQVTKYQITFFGGSYPTINTPSGVAAWARKFDLSVDVKPFEFGIALPEEVSG